MKGEAVKRYDGRHGRGVWADARGNAGDGIQPRGQRALEQQIERSRSG